MKYIVLNWSLSGSVRVFTHDNNDEPLPEKKFIQNTNITVGIEGDGTGRFSIPDGCPVDITGLTVGDSTIAFIDNACREYVDQKYNAV